MNRARVDVHRKENLGATEKAITIFGQPENCTNACNRILKVMQEEARAAVKAEGAGGSGEDSGNSSSNSGDNTGELKVLAHNNLIGRIIGKQVRDFIGIPIRSSLQFLLSFRVPPSRS